MSHNQGKQIQRDYDFAQVPGGVNAHPVLEKWSAILSGDEPPVTRLNWDAVSAVMVAVGGLKRPLLLERFRGYVAALNDPDLAIKLVEDQVRIDLSGLPDFDPIVNCVLAVLSGAPAGDDAQEAIDAMTDLIGDDHTRKFRNRRIQGLIDMLTAVKQPAPAPVQAAPAPVDNTVYVTNLMDTPVSKPGTGDPDLGLAYS